MAQQAAVKATLFDLDDTLFDHRYAARCVLQDLQTRHPALRAQPIEFLELEDFRLLNEKHALVVAGTMGLEESRVQRIQSLFACCGEEISASDARLIADCRRIVYHENRRAVPGAPALLRLLKSSARIGIVTNNFIKEQQGKLQACGLMEFVDALVTPEEMPSAKPNPEMFHAALDRLGCAASEAVMIGDSWDVDVMGALNAGIRAVWFNRRGMTMPARLDVAEITSLEPVEIIARRILAPAG